jgi:hypothetical protein
MSKPPPHTPQVPHNISGNGTVTACPPECARHAHWLANEKETRP